MYQALKEGTVDVAVMLTEGTLKFALEDPSIKIVGVYVASKAIWGVHAGKSSCSFDKIEDMKDETTFAISRFGSGSHLMAYVLAEKLRWSTNESDMRFEVVGNLQGAVAALPKKGNLVFMWEKFTTMPQVVDGTFKRVGELLTPWPFFLIAANAEFLQTGSEELEKVAAIVQKECQLFKTGGESTIQYVNQHYHIQHDAVAEWLPSVSWACELKVDPLMLQEVGNTLARLGQIETATNEQITATIHEFKI